MIRLQMLFAACACAAIPGSEQLWLKQDVRFILIGEMHGTNEGPGIFGDLVCAAGSTSRPIIVGIEHSHEEQGAIDAFMAPSNHEESRRALLLKQDWKALDGRSSRAMLLLLETLRALKLNGRIAEVVAFSDHARTGEPAEKGEERMASPLIAAARHQPRALVIALSGSVHASKRSFTELGSYSTMAMFLPSHETLSLYIADQGGEAWNCQDNECKPHALGPSGGFRRGVVLSKGEGLAAGFDGWLSTGLKATASFPAVR